MFSAIASSAPNTEAMHAKFGATDEGFYSQFVSAELMCSKYDITREEMDAFAAQSHARGLAATTRGAFKDEIVPLMGKNQKTGEAKLHDRDEGRAATRRRRRSRSSTRSCSSASARAPAPGGMAWSRRSGRALRRGPHQPATRRRSATAPRLWWW